MPNWIKVEQVPYLEACIKEGLRLLRLFRRKSRIATDVDLTYGDYVIPKGVRIVGRFPFIVAYILTSFADTS